MKDTLAFAFAAKGRCFLPWGFISKQDTSKNTASHCSFYLFVASQGEYQWKNLRGDKAQRWPSKAPYLGMEKKIHPYVFSKDKPGLSQQQDSI